jgi:hypothetical protein
MKFPNLGWAIDERRFIAETVAKAVGIDPSRFSRCRNGHLDFTQREKTAIAKLLDFPLKWLFREPQRPDGRRKRR